MNNSDLVTAAITRDLARRPEIAHLARVLQSFIPNDAGSPASPLVLHLAKNMIDDPVKRAMLLLTLDVCVRKD